MATFRCTAWNFSKVMGSSTRMILSTLISVGSKPSNSALEKARTSVRLSFPSPSTSCLSKDALRSRSRFSAAALRRALSLAELATRASFSSCSLPSSTFLRCSSISRRAFRAASPSPISRHMRSREAALLSSATLEASATCSASPAALAVASGVQPSPSRMPSDASVASASFSSACFASAPASFRSPSTLSASSFARRSSSWRLRSSSARFSLMSSMRFCACCSASCASCVTCCACEPNASSCFACASSSSARSLS
mmetsp:Transcript_64748/g.202793  ORF Transcript_64748/g.202793 Transcript_64748/m.202793 type:complete len:256 (-) Transcript_64748:194-961(-)